MSIDSFSMSLGDTITLYKSRLEEVSQEIENFPFTVTSIDIENQESEDFERNREQNLDGSSSTSSLTNFEDAQEEEDLKSLSLFQLNSKVKETEANLDSLNKLWLINGLIKEIEHTLDSGNYEDSLCGSAELESVFFNLEKLETKLEEFRESYPSALIVNKLFEHHDTLYDAGLGQIRKLFNKFFPPSEPQVFINPIIVNGVEFEYNGEFVSIFKKYSERNKSESIIGGLLHEKQLVWDKKVLDGLIHWTHGLQLDQQVDERESGETSVKYELKLIALPSTSQSGNSHRECGPYFKSLLYFIRFINLFEDQTLQNYYSSKISRHLTDVISENVNGLISNTALIGQLVQVLELSRRTNWSLAIANSLTSDHDIIDSLNELYLDWLVDNYIDEIRTFFNDEEALRGMFKQLSDVKGPSPQTGTQEKQQFEQSHTQEQAPPNETRKEKDAWNEDWDNEDDAWNDEVNLDEMDEKEDEVAVIPEEKKPAAAQGSDDEWDAWDEEINLEDSPQKPKVSKRLSKAKIPSASNLTALRANPVSIPDTFKVTPIPIALSRIIAKYLSEPKVSKRIEKSSSQIKLLVTSIVSLASITYPTLERSFILYNDLIELHKLVLSGDHAPVTESSISELSKFAETAWVKLKLDLLPYLKNITSNINLEHDDYIAQRSELDNTEFKLDSTTSKQLQLLQEWFKKFLDSETLQLENAGKYKELLAFYINFVNNWIVDSIVVMTEITEYQSSKLSQIIETVEATTLPIAKSRIDINAQTSIKSFHRMENIKFLISNHLKDIMERFYSGEFFDFESDELVAVIRSVFMKSELRENYIQEIIDIRNIDNE